MEKILDFARSVRDFMDRFSKAEVLGIPIDWFFHLTGALVIVYVGARFISVKRIVLLTSVLLVGKELFDIFAKSRVEYIRPPTVDLLVDFSAGIAGIFLGWLLARRRERRAS